MLSTSYILGGTRLSSRLLLALQLMVCCSGGKNHVVATARCSQTTHRSSLDLRRHWEAAHIGRLVFPKSNVVGVRSTPSRCPGTRLNPASSRFRGEVGGWLF